MDRYEDFERSLDPHRADEQAAVAAEVAARLRDRGVTVTGAERPEDLARSEEHTSELQSRLHLVCRLLLEKKKTKIPDMCRSVAGNQPRRRPCPRWTSPCLRAFGLLRRLSSQRTRWLLVLFFFFFNDTATTEIYTLSLHDALPISRGRAGGRSGRGGRPPAGSRRHRDGRRTPGRPGGFAVGRGAIRRSEEHTSELQSRLHLVCRLLLEKKKKK